MDILEDLFYGNLRPCEARPSGEDYRRAQERADALEAALRAQLDAAQGVQLSVLVDAVVALSCHQEAACFAQGFRLGARLAQALAQTP